MVRSGLRGRAIDNRGRLNFTTPRPAKALAQGRRAGRVSVSARQRHLLHNWPISVHRMPCAAALTSSTSAVSHFRKLAGVVEWMNLLNPVLISVSRYKWLRRRTTHGEDLKYWRGSDVAARGALRFLSIWSGQSIACVHWSLIQSIFPVVAPPTLPESTATFEQTSLNGLEIQWARLDSQLLAPHLQCENNQRGPTDDGGLHPKRRSGSFRSGPGDLEVGNNESTRGATHIDPSRALPRPFGITVKIIPVSMSQ